MNIIDLAKQYLTADTISKVSQEVGENQSNVSKAINAFIPLVLGSVINKNSNADGLLHTLKSFGASRGLNSLSTQTAQSPILAQLMSLLFGSNQSSIINKIAEFAGISSDSSTKLFNLTSEATLGSLGKYANDHNLGESEFSSLLNTGKSSLAALIPVGLGLGALGLGDIFGADKPEFKSAPKVEETKTIKPDNNPYVEPVRHDEPEEKSSILKWLLPLLLIFLGGFLVWKYLKKDDGDTVKSTTSTDTVQVDSAQMGINTTTETKTYGTVDLDGVALKAFPGGLEDQIIKFVKSPDYANATEDQLKDKWFNFDNINFVFGKTDQLEGDSRLQLENLAQILKKYPTAKIKIGAYTDNVGNPEDNKVLSQKRADYLKAELGRLGVGAQVVGAEGYGAEFATVPATASDEERAVDRKMSLRFTK